MKYTLYLLSFFFLFSGMDAFEVNPKCLESDWWNYYQGSQEDFEKKIALTDEFLSKIKKSNESHAFFINEFLANLNILNNLKKKKIEPEQDVYPKKTLAFKEWLEEVKKLREQRYRLKDLENELSLDNTSINREEYGISDLFITYLNLDNEALGKIHSGLELMVKKSSVAINKENVRQLKIRISNLNEVIAQYQKLVDHFSSDFSFSQEHLDEINKKIQILKEEYSKELEIKLQLKGDLQTYTHEHGSSEINNDVLEQKLLFQDSLIGYKEIQLLNLQLQKEILLLPKSTKENKAIFTLNELEGWQRKVSGIMSNASTWSITSQKQLARAIESLSVQQNDLSSLQALLDHSQKTLMTTQNIYSEEFLSKALGKLYKTFLAERNNNLVDWAYYQRDNVAFSLNSTFSFFEKPLFSVGETPVNTYGVFKFLIVILLFYIAASLVQKSIKKYGYRQTKIQSAGIYTLSRLFFYIILLSGVLAAFTSIGINLTTFAFIVGALSVGIGFGLQSIFNNFVSGILILLEKNIRIGDVLELDSELVGVVIEINVRNTLIESLDGVDILVPNAELISKRIINRTLIDKIRRIRIPFSVGYDVDKEHLKKILTKAVNNVPMTVNAPNKETQLWLTRLGDNGLDFEMIIWVNEYTGFKRDMGVKSYYLWLIHSVLNENNIDIPYPRSDVFLVKK